MKMNILNFTQALEQYKKTPDSVFIRLRTTRTWVPFKSFDFHTDDTPVNVDKLLEILNGDYMCYVGVIFEGKPLWSGDEYLPEEHHTKLYTPCITAEALYVEVPRMNNNTEVLRLQEAGLLYQDWEEAQRVGRYLLSTIRIT